MPTSTVSIRGRGRRSLSLKHDSHLIAELAIYQKGCPWKGVELVMSIFSKLGVLWHKIHPIIPVVIMLVKAIFDQYNAETVVTSVNDSTHKEGSLHYEGKAVDFRLHHLPTDDRAAVAAKVASALGQDFHVLHEDPGGDNEHLHVEYRGA